MDELYSTSVQETEVNNKKKIIPTLWGVWFSSNTLPLFSVFIGWFGNKEKRAWVCIQGDGIRGRGKKKGYHSLQLFLSSS